MSWVLAIAAAWILLAAVACLFVGRVIALADRRAMQAAPGPDAPNVVADQVPRTATRRTAVDLAGAVPAARSRSDQPDRTIGAARRPPAPRKAATRRHPASGSG